VCSQLSVHWPDGPRAPELQHAESPALVLASPHEFLPDEPVSRGLPSRAYFRRPAGCSQPVFCSAQRLGDSQVHDLPMHDSLENDSLMNDSRLSLRLQSLADFPLASLPHGFRTGPLHAPLWAT
jgi:hypothetical protein